MGRFVFVVPELHLQRYVIDDSDNLKDALVSMKLGEGSVLGEPWFERTFDPEEKSWKYLDESGIDIKEIRFDSFELEE